MPEPDSTTASTPEPESTAPPEGPGLFDAASDFVETAVAYARQETGDLVHDKIVIPTQKAGATVGLAVGVAQVLFLGVLFVAAGALILLAEWIGWPAALFAVGGVMIIAAAGIAYARSRSMQT